MARLGQARRGLARHGSVRLGLARRGEAMITNFWRSSLG